MLERKNDARKLQAHGCEQEDISQHHPTNLLCDQSHRIDQIFELVEVLNQALHEILFGPLPCE